MKIRKVLMISAGVLLAVLAGGVLLGYCVFHGYLWLNNPSEKEYPVWGIDISHYQGEVAPETWEMLAEGEITAKGHKISFAYIKATEGSGHTDGLFEDNWTNSGAVCDGSFRVGAYHFFSFDSPGTTQLQNFTGQVTAIEGMLPPAVDLEFYAGNEKNPPDKYQVLEQLQIMLDGLEEAYGSVPVLYATEESYRYFLEGETDFTQYPLWIRNVTGKPDIGDRAWDIWQFTNRGLLKDENGNGYFGSSAEAYVDINVFRGENLGK